MKFTRVFPLFVLLLSSIGAMAQAGIYAEGSLANLTGLTHNGAPNVGWMIGPTFGAYLQTPVQKRIQLGGDLRGQFFSRNDSNYANTGFALDTKLYTFQFGPRVAFTTPVVALKPYAEFLFGIAHENETISGSGQSVPLTGTGGSFQFLAGADYSLWPLWSWRVLEVGYGHASANVSGGGFTEKVSSSPFIISTGIVFVLPHK